MTGVAAAAAATAAKCASQSERSSLLTLRLIVSLIRQLNGSKATPS